MIRTAEETLAWMLKDFGPVDSDWNQGPLPVHYNKWGPNKSVNVETGIFLRNAVKVRRPEIIVEVGTFRGYSTAWLGLQCWLNDWGKVFTYDIEPEGHYGEMAYSYYGIPEKFISFNNCRVEESVWRDGTVDFVFHDASHELEDTRREVDFLLPKMAPHSMMLFDDVLLPQYYPMGNFLMETFGSYPLNRDWKYTVIGFGHGLGVAERLI